MDKQKSGFIGTVLIGLSMFVFIGSFGAFFLPLINKPNGGTTANMISYMLGLSVPEQDVIQIRWMTAIFVFYIINILLIGFLIYTIFSKQHSKILSIVLMGVVCLFSLISLIVSFNSLSIFAQAYGSSISKNLGYSLSSGPIVFSVLNAVAILSCISGIILSKKGI